LTPDAAYRFRIKLSNSQSWNLYSDEPTREWTERFAKIMNLSKGSSDEQSFSMTFGRNRASTPISRSDVNVEVPANLCHKADIYAMWRSILPIYERAITSGGVPIHAALVEHEGNGYLLAAPGGTGKTTCCQRLPEGWKVLGDDETLLLLSQNGRSYNGHPFPTWSNFYLGRPLRDWEVERSCPIKGIYFLRQASIDSVEALGQGISAALIYQASAQICRRIWKDLEIAGQVKMKHQLFALAGDVARQIPSFMLNVTLAGEFWHLLREAD